MKKLTQRYLQRARSSPFLRRRKLPARRRSASAWRNPHHPRRLGVKKSILNKPVVNENGDRSA